MTRGGITTLSDKAIFSTIKKCLALQRFCSLRSCIREVKTWFYRYWLLKYPLICAPVPADVSMCYRLTFWRYSLFTLRKAMESELYLEGTDYRKPEWLELSEMSASFWWWFFCFYAMDSGFLGQLACRSGLVSCTNCYKFHIDQCLTGLVLSVVAKLL